MSLKTIKNKLKWVFTRHPMLYYTRFVLICKNHKGTASSLPTFNDCNQSKDVPSLFLEVNARMALRAEMDEWEKARAIAAYLRYNIKGGRGLGLSSSKALEIMLAGQGGVCSDFSQVFNLFCLINGVKVREWGSVEKFYNPKYGHTFNEIYVSGTQKWIMLDSKKSIYFNGESGEPLSVIDFFTSLRSGAVANYQFICDYVCPKIGKIENTYSSETIPFVIADYDNKSYDHYLNKFQDIFPPFVINAMMILLRKNYRFLFALDNYMSKLIRSKKKTT